MQVQLDLAVYEAAFAGGEYLVELDGFHFIEGQGAVVAGQGDGLLASVQAGVAGGGEQYEQAGQGEGDGQHQGLHGAAPFHLLEGNTDNEQGVDNIVQLHCQAALGGNEKGQPHALECPAAGDAQHVGFDLPDAAGDKVAATAGGGSGIAVGAGVEQQAGDISRMVRQPLPLFTGQPFTGAQEAERQDHHGEGQRAIPRPAAQDAAVNKARVGLLTLDDLVQAIEGFSQMGDQPAVMVAEGGLGLSAGNAITDFIALLAVLDLAFLHGGDGILMRLPGILGLDGHVANHNRDKCRNQHTINPFQHLHASVGGKRSATIANNCAACRVATGPLRTFFIAPAGARMAVLIIHTGASHGQNNEHHYWLPAGRLYRQVDRVGTLRLNQRGRAFRPAPAGTAGKPDGGAEKRGGGR